MPSLILNRVKWMPARHLLLHSTTSISFKKPVNGYVVHIVEGRFIVVLCGAGRSDRSLEFVLNITIDLMSGLPGELSMWGSAIVVLPQQLDVIFDANQVYF